MLAGALLGSPMGHAMKDVGELTLWMLSLRSPRVRAWKGFITVHGVCVYVSGSVGTSQGRETCHVEVEVLSMMMVLISSVTGGGSVLRGYCMHILQTRAARVMGQGHFNVPQRSYPICCRRCSAFCCLGVFMRLELEEDLWVLHLPRERRGGLAPLGTQCP